MSAFGTASPNYKLPLSFAAGTHTTGMAITNTQAGGYGNALNLRAPKEVTQ